jgi:hypothetical protein
MRIFLTWLLLCLPVLGAVKYVDKDARGSHNGTSWANAYTDFSSVLASAGDIVYVSGGNGSKTYSVASTWNPPAGKAGKSVTFTYSDEVGHNGQVIISCTSGNHIFMQPTGSGTFHDFTWNFWDGTNARCNMTNWQQVLYCNGTTNFTHITFYGVKTEGRVEVIYGGYYYDIGHCEFRLADNSDHAIKLGGPPPAVGWGTNKIHNNTFYLLRTANGSGFGDDGIQWGNSLDIYSNVFLGVGGSYSGTQHQDGIQTDGKYTRVFANTFQDLGNSCFYPDFQGSGGDIYAYNNVFIRQDSALSGSQRGIDDGSDGVNNITLTNHRFWNNTFYGFTGAYALGMYNHGLTVTWNNCDAGNNVFHNCTDSLHHVPSVLTYNNIWSGTSNDGTNNSGGGGSFTVTFVNAPTDLRLATNDTGAFERGTNLVSGLFAVDADNTTRPQSNSWDSGAYQLVIPGGRGGRGGGGGQGEPGQ